MKIIIAGIISLTLLSACDKSKRGSWTDKDKDICIKEYGEERITKGIEDCLCEIAEKKYENWEDAKKYFIPSDHMFNCLGMKAKPTKYHLEGY